MKIYRVAVVEDNPDDQRFLLDLIKRTPFLTLAGSFDDPLMALPFLTTHPVDLLLLDLHLPGLSGFGLMRSLPSPPAVILTTSSLADSLEAFDVGVVDYLVKPIRYERFLRAVNRVLTRQPEPTTLSSPSAIVLKQSYDSVRLIINDITHLEAFGAYSKVHLAGQPTVLVNHSLTELLEKLPAGQFVRVHRSVVVALVHVSTFSPRQLTIGEHTIAVGRAYQSECLRLLNEPKTTRPAR